jgi:hypothetical protein
VLVKQAVLSLTCTCFYRSRLQRQRERQLLEGLAQSSTAVSGTSPFQIESTVARDIEIVEPRVESRIGRQGLPTVPTVSKDIPSMLQSSASQLSDSSRPLQIATHPVVPHRSGSEGSSSIQQRDSNILHGSTTASPGLGIIRRLDGVELSVTEVQDLFSLYDSSILCDLNTEH